MPFEKGHKKSPRAGRKKGSKNKFTRTVKEAFQAAFNEMQEEPQVNLLDWGRNNPTDFYRLSSKLIPEEVNAKLSGAVKVNGRIEFI